jgi:hypothetical protein
VVAYDVLGGFIEANVVLDVALCAMRALRRDPLDLDDRSVTSDRFCACSRMS